MNYRLALMLKLRDELEKITVENEFNNTISKIYLGIKEYQTSDYSKNKITAFVMPQSEDTTETGEAKSILKNNFKIITGLVCSIPTAKDSSELTIKAESLVEDFQDFFYGRKETKLELGISEIKNGFLKRTEYNFLFIKNTVEIFFELEFNSITR